MTLWFIFVCVCRMLLAAAGGGDVIQAGLVLQLGHIPEEHHTNFLQNSLFKQRIFVWVRGLTTSSYILYDYTTSGPEGTKGRMGVCEYTHICVQYTYISMHYIYLFMMQ